MLLLDVGERDEMCFVFVVSICRALKRNNRHVL